MIKQSELNRSHGWRKVLDCGMPKNGELCIAYYPIGEMWNNETTGIIALAYYRHDEEEWVYASTSRKVEFKPAYWKPFSEVSPSNDRAEEAQELVKSIEARLQRENRVNHGLQKIIDQQRELIAERNETINGQIKQISSMGDKIFWLKAEEKTRLYGRTIART